MTAFVIGASVLTLCYTADRLERRYGERMAWPLILVCVLLLARFWLSPPGV